MRNLFIIAVLLTGCTANNSSYIAVQGDMSVSPSTDMDAPANTADMTQQVAPDMAEQPDMVVVVQPDMASPLPDLAQPEPDMTQQAGADMTAPPDMTQLPDLSGNGMYTHHDTFCNDSWTDTSPTVNNQLPAPASAACQACCESVTGAACNPCADNSHVSVGGYAGTVSFYSFTSGTYKYWFYYYDSNAQLKAGKGEQYLTGVGLTNTARWDQ